MDTTTTNVDGGLVPQVSNGVLQDVLTPAPTTVIVAQSSRTQGYMVAQGFGDLFERDALILTQSITNADSDIVPLLGGTEDPHANFFSLPYIQQHTKGYRNAKADIIVTARINAPGLSTGMYVLQAICEGGGLQTSHGIDGATGDIFWNSTQDTYGVLNAELGNTVELHLPWVNWLNSTELEPTGASGHAGCWRLQLYAVAPIQSTTSVTCFGSIDIFARLAPGYELTNLVYEAKHPGHFPVADKPKPTVSGVAGRVAAGITAAAESFPFIAPFAAPAAAAASVVSDIAALFGFTRDTGMRPPEPTINRLSSGMTYVDGSDTSETVAMFQSNNLSSDPREGGGEGGDVASTASLYERWSIVERFNIADTDGVGMCDVPHMPVSPFYCGQTLGRHYLTTAGFVGLPFRYWSGTMEYVIYVVSGPTVKGRMLVTWEPYVNAALSYPTDPSHRVANVSIDLCGTSATVLKVGMSSIYPALEQHISSSHTSTGWTHATANGQLGFYIQAPLVTSKTTGFSVKIVVFARGGSDMKFGVPVLLNSVDEESICLEHIRFEAAPGSLAPVEMATPQFMASTSATYPTKEVLWGEDFLSVRALMQRFSAMSRGRFLTGVTSPVCGFLHHMTPPCNLAIFLGDANATNIQLSETGAVTDTKHRVQFNWGGYYSQLFVGVRGSTRLKISYTGTVDSQLMAAAVRGIDNAVCTTSLGIIDPIYFTTRYQVGDLQTAGKTKSCEWVFPAYSQVAYYQPRAVVDVSGEDIGSAIHVPRNMVYPQFLEPSSSTLFQAFQAYGPDLAIVRFRRVPGLFWDP
jgi:hypothetical protein